MAIRKLGNCFGKLKVRIWKSRKWAYRVLVGKRRGSGDQTSAIKPTVENIVIYKLYVI